MRHVYTSYPHSDPSGFQTTNTSVELPVYQTCGMNSCYGSQEASSESQQLSGQRYFDEVDRTIAEQNQQVDGIRAQNAGKKEAADAAKKVAKDAPGKKS